MSLRLLRLICICIVLLVSTSAATAQSNNARTNLNSYLRILERSYGVSFSYNPKLLSGLSLEIPEDSLSLEESFHTISLEVPVDFEKLEDDLWLVVPRRSDISFFVADEETRQLVPIIHVTVNGQKQFYLLPKDTLYKLKDAFPTDSIQIKSRFYLEQKTTAATLLENGFVFLRPDTIYLDEVSITAFMTTGIDANLANQNLEIDLKNLALLTGETDGDILQTLKNIPGIRTPDGKPGSFNIRGSTFDQNLISFDDIPIYHTGHFFGTFSPYNPGIVEKITVQRGTLPARFGGRVGGMVAIQTKDEVPDSAQFGISANTVFSSAKMSLPLVPKKLGLHLSGRSNYPTNYLSPKLQAYSNLNFQGSQIDPDKIDGTNQKLDLFKVRFQDFNGKLVYDINQRNKASISFIDIINHFGYDFKSSNINLLDNQRVVLNNWGLSGKWQSQLTKKLSLNTGLTTSSINILEKNKTIDSDTVKRDDLANNQIRDYRIFTDGTLKFNTKTTLAFGYKLVSYEVKYEERNALKDSVKTRNQQANVHSAYLSLQKDFGDRLVTNFGLHSDYYTLLDQFYLDPRVSLSYRVSDRFYLKSSAGRAHQYLKQEFKNDFNDFRTANNFWFLSDRNRPVLTGLQVMTGATYDLPGWLFDLEVYSKKTTGISNPAQTGNLLSHGVDLFVKRRWNRMETWIGYSYSNVQTDFGQKQVAYFNQSHSINLMHLIHWNQWQVAASWQFTSGMPVIIPSSTEQLSISYSGHFPLQHQLDLSMTYSFPEHPKGYRGVIGLSILNLYNHQNIINIFQQNPQGKAPYRYTVGFAPNLQVGFNF